MQNILSISTAATCIVAVETPNGILVKTNKERRGQAEYLVPMIQDCLAESGITFQDLQRIGIVTGPGSFTGIRVGLSTVRGLALALENTGCDAVGISAFSLWQKAYATAHGAEGKTLIALDTLRDDCFSMGYLPDGKLWLPPMVRDTASLQQIVHVHQPVLIGDGAHMLSYDKKEFIEDAQLAQALLDLTLEADAAAQPVDPYYLRAPDVTIAA